MSVKNSILAEIVTSCVQELGYAKPTDHQQEAVQAFLSGEDMFVSLPTGSGKSVCYACTPLVFPKLVQRKRSVAIVISPLNALMQDQVARFYLKGNQGSVWREPVSVRQHHRVVMCSYDYDHYSR